MIEKVDAHHHLWRMGSSHYPILAAPDADRFLGNTGRLKHDFWAAQFVPLAQTQNVTQSVHVEAHYAPPTEETAAIDSCAREFGFPNAIIGRVDFASAELHRDLDIHMRSSLFRGVRTMLNWDDDPKLRAGPRRQAMNAPDWRRGYAEIGHRGLSVEAMVTPAQLIELARLAEAIPTTPLVVGHAGLPLRRSLAEEKLWDDGMVALAALPHVFVKISGLGMVDHEWTVASITPIVRRLIETFGADRCMFASNFPVDGLHATYAEIWDAFDTIAADDPEQDRAALFRETAQRFYRLEPVTQP